jgi:sugar lactone lactonase YvrE
MAVMAVTPQFWENFTQEELLKGTLTRVSLSWDGKLALAPAYDLVYDTNQAYIFSMVRDKSGNLYVGTGHECKVFKIDPQGNGSLYFQAKELDIFALALDSADTLYVATSPEGKVYKVTAANQATEFCNPEDRYIWSLVFDDAGNLFVGTGARGVIYKVDRSGKKATFYTSADNHIVSLARESNGNLLAGTSPAGRVLEITPQGKAFTLLDTPMEEVRSLVVDRFGTIYAVAASGKKATPETGIKIEPAPDKGGALPIATIQALSAIADRSKEARTSVSAPGGEKDSAGAKSAIFAISKDGGVETVYTSKDQIVFDALVRNDETILAATGGKGRLLSIDTAKQVTVLTDSPEEQMTRLVQSGDTVWVAGSNQGKIYKLQAQRAQNGTYESRVLDAKTVASWGKIFWRTAGTSGGSVELATRSGNTDNPDSSWSDWSAAYSTAAGQPVTNPRARYLQWRATFKRGGTPAASSEVLERVQIAYLQQNVRPQVVNINLLPSGVVLQKTPSLATGIVNISPTTPEGPALNSPRERGKDKQPIPPRQVLQAGAQAFIWKATDDNDDTLEYSLYFKGEGESEWKVLEKKLTDSFYTLDSNSLPDGVYTLKVVASDQPSNPFGKFLIAELISRPFVIANSTPVVDVSDQKIQGKRLEVQFRAKVPNGRIASAEFSIDGGEWYLVFPKDGIADSAQEEFQLTTPEISTGEHIVGLRATDGNGNTGTSKIIIKIP